MHCQWIIEYETRLWLNEDRAVVDQQTITLYPMDRPESKGRMMMLIFELEGTDVLLACDFRLWSGNPATRTKYGEDGAFGTDELGRKGSYRGYKQGLTCTRNYGPGYRLSREDARVDFNILDGDITDTLPTSAGGDPSDDSMNVALQPGKTWYHVEGGFSISVLNVGPNACDQAPLCKWLAGVRTLVHASEYAPLRAFVSPASCAPARVVSRRPVKCYPSTVVRATHDMIDAIIATLACVACP